MAKGFPKPKKWTPKNVEKYVGDPNLIISRSSWEMKFMRWCDSNPDVLNWASEEAHIPYMSPVDGRVHRYFVDFIIKVRRSDGSTKTYAVEVKPYCQTLPPKGTKKTKRLLEEQATYAINQAKWEAADAFFRKKGIEFIVITEYELGLKKRP